MAEEGDMTEPVGHAERDPTRTNVAEIARLEEDALRQRTTGERVSAAITRRVGTVAFVALQLAGFAGWFAVNLGLVPGAPVFDPFPFGILTLVVSAEGVFLALFILISQNRMSRLADRRTHLDLQVSLLAEQELTLMLRLQTRICDHLGIDATAAGGPAARRSRPSRERPRSASSPRISTTSSPGGSPPAPPAHATSRRHACSACPSACSRSPSASSPTPPPTSTRTRRTTPSTRRAKRDCVRAGQGVLRPPLPGPAALALPTGPGGGAPAAYRGTRTVSRGLRLDSHAMPSRSVSRSFGSDGSRRSSAWAAA
jgi:uncharacterized membrane protein